MKKTNGFLTETGREIFNTILLHCNKTLKMKDVDEYELTMLANSFDMYARAAKLCNEDGVSMTFKTEKGTYSQIRPEYTVMKNEYQNILKHGAKFGLNPADRKKIFNVVEKTDDEFSKY